MKEIVTKANWKWGLWCTRCGKRILYGHNVVWLDREAACERCAK